MEICLIFGAFVIAWVGGHMLDKLMTLAFPDVPPTAGRELAHSVDARVRKNVGAAQTRVASTVARS